MTAGRLAAIAALAAACALPAGAAGVPGHGTWQTTLKPRDLDQDGKADAFYDTVLKVTWLRNADIAGGMFWPDAKVWAEQLEFGGYTDWRLPTVIDSGKPGCNFAYSGSDCGYNVQTKSGPRTFSEMAHLFNVTLGNKGYCDASGNCDQPGWGLTNTGNFQNLHNSFYWTSVEYGPRPDLAWYYYAYTEYQSFGHKNHLFYALAVRTGDVRTAISSPVPEPNTAFLTLVGLGLLAARRASGRVWRDYLKAR